MNRLKGRLYAYRALLADPYRALRKREPIGKRLLAAVLIAGATTIVKGLGVHPRQAHREPALLPPAQAERVRHESEARGDVPTVAARASVAAMDLRAPRQSRHRHRLVARHRPRHRARARRRRLPRRDVRAQRGRARRSRRRRPRVARRGGEATGVVCDVTTAAGVAALVDGARAAFGGVDLLVNNVGGSGARDFHDVDDADFAAALDRNLWPAFRVLARGRARAARARRRRHRHDHVDLGARKRAARPATTSPRRPRCRSPRRWRAIWRATNIRVNAVAPGSILFPGGGWERAPEGRSRRHRRVRRARAAVRPLRRARGGGRRGRLPLLAARALGSRRHRRRRRRPEPCVLSAC